MAEDINKSLLTQFYGFNQDSGTLSFSSSKGIEQYNKITDVQNSNEKSASATEGADKNQYSRGDATEYDENDENNLYKSPHVLTVEELAEEPGEVQSSQESSTGIIEIPEEKKDPKASTRLEDTLFKAMFKMSENPINLESINSEQQDSSPLPSSPVAKAKTLWRQKTMISKENLLASILSKFNGTYLNLNKTGIYIFPVDILDQLSDLQMLYLDSNSLTDIPEQLFIKLKKLKWLDVRNNQLTSVPSSIKGHASLETLLLQGNNIERLPLELGLVPNLKNLQVAHNPLIFPPREILDSDCSVIINLLRSEWNKAHPNEMIELKKSSSPKIGKSPSTIICYESAPTKPYLKNKSKSSQNLEKTSVRSKSWNYKPSNRCQSADGNVQFQQKMLWMAAAKELLSQQAAELQKSMTRRVLNEWRRGRQFSRRKSSGSSKNTPYSLDTPFALHHEALETKPPGGCIREPLDFDKNFDEFVKSLKELNERSVSNNMTPQTRQKQIQAEMEQINLLLKKLDHLKAYNDSHMLLSIEVEPASTVKYVPSPSIMI